MTAVSARVVVSHQNDLPLTISKGYDCPLLPGTSTLLFVSVTRTVHIGVASLLQSLELLASIGQSQLNAFCVRLTTYLPRPFAVSLTPLTR